MASVGLASLTVFIGLFSCGNSIEASSSPERINPQGREIGVWDPKAPYASPDPSKAVFLWGSAVIPEFVSPFVDIDALVPGDSLRVDYTGVWMEYASYPAVITIQNGKCVNATVKYGEVKEASVRDGQIYVGESEPIKNLLIPDYAVDREKSLVPLSEVESGYVVCSAGSGIPRILLTYNPREAKQ